jgi:PAS domain S-box-containing protein
MAAWKTYKAIRDTFGEAHALANIGTLNRTLQSYGPALEYLQKGVVLAQKANRKPLLGMLYGQIALTYQAMNDRETAVHFFTKAIAIFRQTGSKKDEYRMESNLGSILMDEGRDEEALAMFNRLLVNADSTDTELLGILYTRISHIYYKRKDYRSSLNYNLKALAARQRQRAPVSINSSLINIAGDYYALEKPDSATIYMDSGLVLALRNDRKNLVMNCYRHIWGYYQRKGDYNKALDYYARYSAVQGQINGETTRNNIAILEKSQQLKRIQQSGKIIEKMRDVRALNIKLHHYEIDILLILIGLAGCSMIIFIFMLLHVRRVRRKMQEINVHLSEEIREREVMEGQTRDHEKQYKFITDNSVDFITHLNQKNERIYASPASLKVYGYEQDEMMTKSVSDLTHPDYCTYTEAMFNEMIETRSARQFIYLARKKDGSSFWVESILNPLFDPITGVFKGMVGVTRDIQERKTKEFEIMEGTKQKENLLKEIHHRVKNNFAILVSLINMQMAQVKSPELLQSLTNLQLRIRTMALVHEMLYRSSDFEKISFPGYLRSLASVIAGTYNRRDVELTVEADEVVMDIEASIPLGLIINEILSNSYKHAFPGERAGKIRIHYSIDPQTGTNTLVLQDDGIGIPGGTIPGQLKTMGLQVVQILCDQIEARLMVSNDPGARFVIDFQMASR